MPPKSTVHIVSDLVATLDDIIAINSLAPTDISEPLQYITTTVYNNNVLTNEDKRSVIDTLHNMPLSLAQQHYGQQHLNADYNTHLELIQAVCVHAECEHDKHVSRETHNISDHDIAKKLDSMPDIMSLAALKSGENEGTEIQADTRLAAFYAMRDQYPYRWACARAESESIALEHIIPTGLQSNDIIAYVGSAASPFSAMSMIVHNAAQGINIKAAYIDDDPESARLARTEIKRMEKLGIVPQGSITVLEGNAQNMPDFNTLLGATPKVGVVTAAIANKTEAANALDKAGVQTINVLSTQGLAELMYSRVRHDEISEHLPLRAIAKPAHIAERLPTGEGIAVIKADENPEKRFWVTPLFFSNHPWKTGLDHERVIDPPKKHSFANNITNHPRRIAPTSRIIATKNIAIATCAALPNILHPDGEDQLLVSRLRTNGFNVKGAVWDDPNVDWSKFDAVIIRTAYDYKDKPQEFNAWMDRLENQNVHLLNDKHAIKGNLHKGYLLELTKSGANVIPTDIIPQGTNIGSLDLTHEYGWKDVIIKPAIGSGGDNTVLLKHGDNSNDAAKQLLATGDMLVQPFMPEIYEGEHSLMFFGGKFSHAVVKQPNGSEFRVHEKFGGTTYTVTPEDKVLETAQKLLNSTAPNATYARVDGIMKNGEFLLMELELIEPWMYLKNAPSPKEAAKNFANAIEARLKELSPSITQNHFQNLRGDR